MKMIIHYHDEGDDIDFNPHGYHENSGVAQWFDECLIAIAETNGKLRIIELPPSSLVPQKSKRSFGDYDKAETYRDAQYDKDTFVFVAPEDIEEEIERRKGLLAKKSPYAGIVQQYASEKTYRDFLESTVDNGEYNAYLDHIAQPRAEEY